MQQAGFVTRNNSSPPASHTLGLKLSEVWQCGVCGKVFESASSLRQHMMFTYGIDPKLQDFLTISLEIEAAQSADSASNALAYSVKSVDSRDSASDVDLNHEKTTTEPFSCPKCNTVSRSYKGLKQHLAKSHQTCEKPEICGECGKGFKHRNGLRCHVRQVHEKSTRVICDLCGQAVYNKYMLEMHRPVCKGTGQLYCPECNKECRNYKGLQQHLAKAHQSSDKAVTCAECGKAFKHKHALKFHMRQVHEGSTRVMCDRCGKPLYNKYKLKQHLRVCESAN